MKLIVLYNNYSTTTFDIDSETLGVYTLPDTALLKDGKPFFIPDFANPCTLQGHLVVRICRLGRSISERFAHRYYDAITVGATFTAENLRKELSLQHRPWDLAVGFDGAAVIGKMIPLYTSKQQTQLEEEVGVNINFQPLKGDIQFFVLKGDTKIVEGVSDMMLNHIDNVIAQISKHYTLRQGDLIFTGCPTQPQIVNINDKITGWLGAEKVLQFNVK